MFLFKIVCFVLLFDQVVVYDYEDGYKEYDYEEEETTDLTATFIDTALTRVRRFDDKTGRTLSADEIREVRGALKQMRGAQIENQFTSLPLQATVTYTADQNTETDQTNKDLRQTGVTEYNYSLNRNDKEVTNIENEDDTVIDTKIITDIDYEEKKKYFPLTVTESNLETVFELQQQTHLANALRQLDTTPTADTAPTADTPSIETNTGDNAFDNKTDTVEELTDITTMQPTTTVAIESVTEVKNTTTTKPLCETRKRKTKKTTTTTTTTTTTRTTTLRFDIPALLEIIANLTYDYETNLTHEVNETLQKWSVPTCPVPTTTPEPTTTTTEAYDFNATGVVMAKCFVCGLEVTEIPRTAHCSDAFAGDFLPLVPVDPTSRGHIAQYRKYCRYLNVFNYVTNASDPRSIWGRWTGGCSVRWIDLSGIYTQRSCRSKKRATVGKHFASKRMAKLEMALKDVENGCIFSPVSSLVPLSRGISLYARFHACVCTGNWCNTSAPRPWAPGFVIATLLLFVT